MGVAITWVLFAHSGVSFSFLPIGASLMQFIKSNGFGGVDLFLFLSGFGVFRSLSHNEDPAAFYGRRIKRVLPVYLPILILWLLVNVSSISWKALPFALWNNLIGLSFWLQKTPAFNWYILALPSFYLLAPVFFQAMKRWRERGVLFLLIFTLLLDLSFSNSYIMIAISRFTIFVLGMAAGRGYLDGKECAKWQEYTIYLLGVIGWILLYIAERSMPQLLWNYGLYWYPFILITPASLLLLCRIFDVLGKHGIGKVLNSCLAGMGKCSLEIYLIHVKIFERVTITSNWAWLFLMVMISIVGYAYHTVITKTTDKLPEINRQIGTPKALAVKSGTTLSKITYIEAMRVFACFLVIVNHTEAPLFFDRGPSLTWFVGLLYFFICKIAVPLFLMIMGAVLLEKEDTPRKTAQRLVRGCTALLAASVVYYIYYGIKYDQPLSPFDFLKNVIRTQTTNALWYLYLYLGLLCLLPILQKLAKALEKRDLQWLLFLSVGILGTIPLIQLFIPEFGVSGYFTGILFSNYIGMVLCGYYIEHYAVVERPRFWASAALFSLLILFQAAATYYFYQADPTNYLRLDNRTFITITGSTICFYVMVKYVSSKLRLGARVKSGINYFGGLTFGIYLFSDLIIDLTRPIHQALCGYTHVVIAMVLWEIIIFAICALLTASLKTIPALRKWI